MRDVEPRSAAPRALRASAGLTALAVVLLAGGAAVEATGNLVVPPAKGSQSHPPPPARFPAPAPTSAPANTAPAPTATTTTTSTSTATATATAVTTQAPPGIGNTNGP